MPNWAEQVTAIATAVGAIGLLSAIGAAVFAGQQVREARVARQAEMAADFFRRWNGAPLVETRRLVSEFDPAETLRDTFMRLIAENPVDAYVLYRELDYFEQLGALEEHGGFDFELIRMMLGRRLIDRWPIPCSGGSSRRCAPPCNSHRGARLGEHLDAADASVVGEPEAQTLGGAERRPVDLHRLRQLCVRNAVGIGNLADLHLVAGERRHQTREEGHVVGLRRIGVLIRADPSELVCETRFERGPVVGHEAVEVTLDHAVTHAWQVKWLRR